MARVPTSIVDQLTQAHVDLLRELKGMEEIVTAPCGGEPCDTTYHLVGARGHLEEHFRFEEQGGYLRAVLERDPHLAHAVQELEAEHRAILEEMDSLIADAKAGHARDADFQPRVRRCVARVRRHESEENRLIQDAFNLEIHAGD